MRGGNSRRNHVDRRALNADCQAGIYTGLEQLLGRPITQQDAHSAFLSFCALGDDDSVPWFKSDAHGTCEQRATAFTRGYGRMLEYGSLICAGPGQDRMGRPTGIAAITALCDP